MKIAIFLTLFSLLGLSVKASGISSSSNASTEISNSYSPEVCQFSLSSYNGVISGGYTGKFKVGLSCPQERDVRATVIVFINNEHTASKVVTIKAGADYSESVSIEVGQSHNGEKYKLVVQ